MASLKDHPIKFNNTAIYFPSTFTVSRRVIENVTQTEAGTDVIELTRKNKVTVDFDTNTTSDWVATFEEFADMNYFTLAFWNDGDNAYEEHTVRLRSFQKSLIKKSWDVSGFNGLWKVSFTLEEF